MVPDDKARPVGICENDEPPLFRQAAEKGCQLCIVEHPEARSLKDHGIHHLGQGVFIIAALDHDGLPDVEQSPRLLLSVLSGAPVGHALRGLSVLRLWRCVRKLQQQLDQKLLPIRPRHGFHGKIGPGGLGYRHTAPAQVVPPGGVDQLLGRIGRAQAPQLHQISGPLPPLQGQPGGVELPELPPQHGQNLDGGLSHVEKISHHRSGLVKVSAGDGIGELKHHRVQLRSGHRVDILPGDYPVSGVGPDLADL